MGLVGRLDGCSDGCPEGCPEGCEVGLVGAADGWLVGSADG